MAETVSHTPGPWTYVDDEIRAGAEGDVHVVCFGHDYDEYGCFRATGSLIVKKGNLDGVPLHESYDWTAYEAEKAANIRLITAAPDLLASCKELREALAGAIRVLYHAGLTDPFMLEMSRIGIVNGLGKRADDLIAKVEGR